MANFSDAPHFDTHDDYYTRRKDWENIEHFIEAKYPKDTTTVWECFSKNSNEQSINNLRDMGWKVKGSKHFDFLTNEGKFNLDLVEEDENGLLKLPPNTIVISNPPYRRIKSYKQRKDNLKYKCFKKLLDYDIPFVILINQTHIFQKWCQELIAGKDIKFIYPSYKIGYDKYKEGGVEKIDMGGGSPSYNTVYMTYKILDKNEFI
tara:strand:- start:1816 stop:2430 length:615 start_codon:yes stop_codon:yes gene_type:complete